MFSIVRSVFAGALIVAGTVVAAEQATAGIGYYYAAPSYYYAPPVYGPPFSNGYYGNPAYYGGYGPLGTSTYYRNARYRDAGVLDRYGYSTSTYYSPYRYHGYHPFTRW